MNFFSWLGQWVRTAVAASSRKEFYRRIEERKPREAVAHLALLAVFLEMLPLLIAFFIGSRYAARSAMETVRTRVPAGTAFELKGGRLTSTLKEPLVFSEDMTTLILDPATTTGALAAYSGTPGNVIVIGSDGIMDREGSQQARFTSFQNFPEFSLTREQALTYLSRWTPWFLFGAAVLFALISFLMGWIGFLISAAVHAALLWLALRIAKRGWPWKRAFVASAYAATLPFVLSTLLPSVDARLGFLPGLAYWLILVWIAYDIITRDRVVPGKGESDERQNARAVDRPDEDRRQAE